MLGLEKPWKIIQEKNYASIELIAKNKKIKSLKIEEDLFSQDDFTDWYHLNSAGEIKKARRIGEFIMKDVL